MENLVQKARELVERKKKLIKENTRLFLEQGINYIGDKERPKEYEEAQRLLVAESQKIGQELMKMIKEAEEVLKILKVDFMAAIKIESAKAREEMQKAIIEKANKKPEDKEYLS